MKSVLGYIGKLRIGRSIRQLAGYRAAAQIKKQLLPFWNAMYDMQLITGYGVQEIARPEFSGISLWRISNGIRV